MKKLFLLPLLFLCQIALADWSRVAQTSHPEPQQYIDLDSVKQTGPMAIMRRVWELRNYSVPDHDKVRSVKRLSEYDCMDRRHRVLQEFWFAEEWAKGESVTPAHKDKAEIEWRPIVTKSVNEIILDEMCPQGNDGQ